MSSDAIVISSFARTPMGAFQGVFSDVAATQLGAVAVKAAVERSRVDPAAIDRIYMGCVLSAGLGQAPARQAALGGGLPVSVEATTISKVCGSGMQAIIMATEALAAGSASIIVAGGMESMTNAPYLMPDWRRGVRLGHGRMVDSMLHDGLEDAYAAGEPMGAFAEDASRAYGFKRADLDAYAIESLRRANAAIQNGAFEGEIAPVTIKTKAGETLCAIDEQPGKAKPDKIPFLKPAFAKDGVITAASSASISDGAAALVLTRVSIAKANGLPVAARIVAAAAHAQAPSQFTTAPAPAISKTLAKAGWCVDDVDLFEINEAFAVVPMIAVRELGISHHRVNINGGATALGHPIGCSGARILVTLIAALHARGLKRGVASLCIGGGEATALAVELV